jgi:hypothetical protein
MFYFKLLSCGESSGPVDIVDPCRLVTPIDYLEIAGRSEVGTVQN